MKFESIRPVKSLSGSLELPGDKSISHRYAMLAALAEGTSELRNFAAARDCHSTLACVKALGAGVQIDGSTIKVTGHGLHGLRSSWRTLDAENSGTTIRLLSGILSGQSFTTKISGDSSLQKRPMKRVITPLREMGADIRGRDDNYPPLEIRGSKLKALHYEMPIASAQVKSAVLLAGLYAEGETCVTEPAATRDHTELALQEFGAPLRKRGKTISIQGVAGSGSDVALKAVSVDVPGDLSSAVFFIAAASVLPASNLYIANVGLNPTRSAILDFFSQMGASISVVNLQSKNGELVGDLSVKGTSLKGGLVSGSLVPLLIDELPMLAALGPYTEQGIEIRDAGELRVKESDRIAALAENLKRMGAKVEERSDGLRVEGGAGPLHGAEIDPRGDHRIAMAFAVAGLAAQGETRILDPECAAVSYPTFYSELRRLAQQ